MTNLIHAAVPIRAVALTLASLLALAACEKKAGPPQGTTIESAVEAALSTHRTESADPCSLLERAEVEVAMGPLAGAPYRGDDAGAAKLDGSACLYQTADYRLLIVEPTWRDGAGVLAAVSMPGRIFSDVKGDAKDVKKSILPGGLQMEGEWDEAQSQGCCRIWALRGDSLIAINYEGWKNDTPAAVGVLNKALLRLDKPMTSDGNAGVAAALEREKARPKPVPTCTLIPKADVEAIVGPLLAEPKSSADERSCTYRFNIAAAKTGVIAEAPEMLKDLMSAVGGAKGGFAAGPLDTDLTVVWRGGFHHLADNLMIGGAMQSQMNSPGVEAPPAIAPDEGGWSEAAQSSLAFVAVKKDVAITVPTAMLPADTVKTLRRLVAKAMEKI
jgi:hypothetical protein